MDKIVYVLFGQKYDWNDDGEQPKYVIGIYSSYKVAEKEKDENSFYWDILTIEEYPVYG